MMRTSESGTLAFAREPGALTAAAQSGTSLRQRSPNMTEAGPQQRRRSVAVDVGGVLVGGGAPIVVQSMTNTDTADVEENAAHIDGHRPASLLRPGFGDRARHRRPQRGGRRG